MARRLELKIRRRPSRARQAKKKKSSETQAVVFNPGWKASAARLWLKKNGFKPIKKVHKTSGGFLRYRITDPKQYRSFFWRKTSKGINFVIGLQ